METKEENYLVPSNTYLKTGIHIGTKFKTKYMEPFIYKTRPDGLSVLNLQKIDERLRVATRMVSNYEPQDILFVCRRENGWKGAKKFADVTGIRVIAGRYPPGILTNSELETFIEPKLVIVSDPYPDRNVISDAMKIGIPVIALCDTNNTSNYIDLVIPCNNKGKKSLGLIFFVLAVEYLKSRGLYKEGDFVIDDFSDE